jgi:AraC family transcriptional regulator
MNRKKMIPRIELANEKKLVGKHLTMSYADYRIGELWRAFMPRRKEINNTVSNDLISLVIYSPTHFADFKPTNEFERWAAVEVENFDDVPDDVETYILTSGLFAVFHYTGLSTDSAAFYQYIYLEWLPNSEYQLDDRPHVEILGEKYKNNDPLSEEDVWIPIKLK